MSGIGHNGPPVTVKRTALDEIEAIVDSKLSATKKLILVKIRLRADKRTLGGAIQSHATLAQAASVDDPRTIKTALKHLCQDDGLLVREDRSGQAPRFGFRRDQLEAMISEWVAKKNSKQRNVEPPSSNVGGAANVPPSSNVGGNAEPPSLDVGGEKREPPSFHAGGEPEPPSSHVPRSGSTIRKEVEEGEFHLNGHALNGHTHPAAGERVASGNGSASGIVEPQATPSPHRSAEDEMAAALVGGASDAWWAVDGRIAVTEEFRRKLEADFPNVVLKDALAIVGDKQTDGDGRRLAHGAKLKSVIERQCAYLNNDNRMKVTTAAARAPKPTKGVFS